MAFLKAVNIDKCSDAWAVDHLGMSVASPNVILVIAYLRNDGHWPSLFLHLILSSFPKSKACIDVFCPVDSQPLSSFDDSSNWNESQTLLVSGLCLGLNCAQFRFWIPGSPQFISNMDIMVRESLIVCSCGAQLTTGTTDLNQVQFRFQFLVYRNSPRTWTP